MRTRISSRIVGALTFATLGLALQAQDVIVVANQDVSVSEVTDTELHDLFTGARTRFHDGSRALPVLLKGGPAHEVFLSHYIGETSDGFRALWRKAVFTGQGAAPREFASEAALLEYVAVTPGAMGYVSHLRTQEKIKVLLVRNTNTRNSAPRLDSADR